MAPSHDEGSVSGLQGEETARLDGSPTILIVDDEELLRDVTTIMIEENGGNVLVAIDGQHGVEVFNENKDKIDVVFMDFSMPRMNGYEAFLKVREIKPDVGVIMVSGLIVTPEVDELRKRKEIEFLSKPFHEVELMRLINQLLRKRRTEAA
jgi:DNA-binding NtrC family response regulator